MRIIIIFDIYIGAITCWQMEYEISSYMYVLRKVCGVESNFAVSIIIKHWGKNGNRCDTQALKAAHKHATLKVVNGYVSVCVPVCVCVCVCLFFVCTCH